MESDLARKLGLQPGQRVLLIGASRTAVDHLRKSSSGAIRFLTRATSMVDQVFWWPKEVRRLPSELARLKRILDPGGAVWIVMPKKPFALARGVRFTWEEMQAQGLKGDFVDNKIATIDDQEYATRFVLRRDRRRTRPKRS